MEAVIRKGDIKFKNPCGACFCGKYVTGDITEEVLNEVEAQRKCERENLCEKSTGLL